MAGKCVITKDEKGEFHFSLEAGSGEIIAIARGYATKASALKSVESVRKNAADAVVVDESQLPSVSAPLALVNLHAAG